MRAHILVVLTVLMLAGCAGYPKGQLIPFSDALVTHYQLADDEVLRLQYYLSRDLELQAVNTLRQHSVKDGHLLAESETLVDRLIIPRGTPGIAIAAADNTLQVSFAEGSQLTFAPDGQHDKAVYRLVAEVSPTGEAHVYAIEQAFRVVSGAPLPYLAINRELLERGGTRTIKWKGRTLDTP